MLRNTRICKQLVSRLEGRKSNSNGFTLVEVLAVIVILGILLAVAVVSVGGLIGKAEEDVCGSSIVEIERYYEVYLESESIENPELHFAEFLLGYDGRACPSGGELRYFDGRVKCSVHSDDGDEHVDPEVPYL